MPQYTDVQRRALAGTGVIPDAKAARREDPDVLARRRQMRRKAVEVGRHLRPKAPPPLPSPAKAVAKVSEWAECGRNVVLRKAAEAYGITLADLARGGLSRRVTAARTVAAYVLRRGCKLSLQATAAAVGMNSHTSASAAVWRMQRAVERELAQLTEAA